MPTCKNDMFDHGWYNFSDMGPCCHRPLSRAGARFSASLVFCFWLDGPLVILLLQRTECNETRQSEMKQGRAGQGRAEQGILSSDGVCTADFSLFTCAPWSAGILYDYCLCCTCMSSVVKIDTLISTAFPKTSSLGNGKRAVQLRGELHHLY